MRRPDNEPLLFDLPLDRPARDGEAEPVLERPPQRGPRPPHSSQGPQPSARRSSPATGRTAPAQEGASSPTPLRPRDLRSERAAQAARPDAAEPTRRAAAADRADQTAHQGEAAADRADHTAHQGEAAAAEGAASPSIADDNAGIGRRLAAGAADLLVHVAVAVLALAGCRYLGVILALRDWPALGVFLLSFSFLYTVVPLAFWGHTLGMTWAGLTSESLDGEPLSFDQTARRWLGTLVTLATLGLALLLALTGRSLSDRLSGSRTFAA
jgi:uncharacterized RDD family membrane protein YckC